MTAHSHVFVWLLVPVLFGAPVLAQADKSSGGKKPPVVPTISGRSFTGGTANVTVTGTFQLQAEIALNTKASFGDGEMTWIQFGASGSKEPNALITYGQEIGINVGRGSNVVTAEGESCSGEATVTGNSVSGHYSCTGITAYDQATGKMGKVDIAIRFTTKS